MTTKQKIGLAVMIAIFIIALGIVGRWDMEWECARAVCY